MSNHLCITLQNYFHFILTLTTYKRRGGDSSTDFLLIKDDTIFDWSKPFFVTSPLLCDWWHLKVLTLSRVFFLTTIYIFFFTYIWYSGQTTATSLSRQTGYCAYYWPRCPFVYRRVWWASPGKKTKKNPSCWSRLLGCSPTCGPYVSSPVVTSSARGSS